MTSLLCRGLQNVGLVQGGNFTSGYIIDDPSIAATKGAHFKLINRVSMAETELISK